MLRMLALRSHLQKIVSNWRGSWTYLLETCNFGWHLSCILYHSRFLNCGVLSGFRTGGIWPAKTERSAASARRRRWTKQRERTRALIALTLAEHRATMMRKRGASVREMRDESLNVATRHEHGTKARDDDVTRQGKGSQEGTSGIDEKQ